MISSTTPSSHSWEDLAKVPFPYHTLEKRSIHIADANAMDKQTMRHMDCEKLNPSFWKAVFHRKTSPLSILKTLKTSSVQKPKLLGISSMDPTGMGYVSKTYSSIVGGGEPMNAIEFQKLVMHPSIKKYKPKIIVGGFGSWQLERKHVSDSYGVDCVLIGGRPGPIVELFKKAVNGEANPTHRKSR